MTESELRLLLVDDEEPNRDLGKELLERNGSLSVDTVGKPADALETAGNYDGVVIDYNLPGTSGTELLKEMEERYGDIDAVIYSGHRRKDVDIPEDVKFRRKEGPETYSDIAEYFKGS